MRGVIFLLSEWRRESLLSRSLFLLSLTVPSPSSFHRTLAAELRPLRLSAELVDIDLSELAVDMVLGTLSLAPTPGASPLVNSMLTSSECLPPLLVSGTPYPPPQDQWKKWC